ncbi:TPA: hypothetical protein NZJ50_004631, partial [Salmonella enterica subsp. enterica serovar Ruiru]|nr:hypothetical protein [Salmonella enterica subsp. enterica serovar Ruiru]
TITGLNATKTFTLNAADAKPYNGGHNLITPIDMSLLVTGCGNSVDAQVNMQGNVNNNGWSGPQLGILQGLFSRVAIKLNGIQNSSDNWIPGQSKTFTLQNGAGSVPVFFSLMKGGGAGLKPQAGVFNNTAEIVIDNK